MPRALTELERAEREANAAFKKLLKARGSGIREKRLTELLTAVTEYQSALDAENVEDE